jgi:hypothetical protein
MSQLTFLLEEPHANHSQSQDLERDWTTLVATSCLPTLPLLQSIGPSGWFGRMSPASYPLTEDSTLPASFEGWANSGMGSHTEFLTLSTSEWPSAAAVCSLSDTLETGRRAAAVLFERHSLQGNIAPRRQEGEKVAPTVTTGAPFSRTGNESVECEAIVAQCLTTRTGSAFDPFMETMPVTTGALCARTGQSISVQDASQSHLLPVIAFPAEMSGTQSATTVNLSPALSVKHTTAVAYDSTVTAPLNTQLGLRGPDVSNSLREGVGIGNVGDPAFTLQASHGHGVITPSQVRRLTPIECERLQGFPDNYTDIRLNDKQTPDGPRYKAMGNSMAVPVMRWIGERIQKVEDLNG